MHRTGTTLVTEWKSDKTRDCIFVVSVRKLMRSAHVILETWIWLVCLRFLWSHLLNIWSTDVANKKRWLFSLNVVGSWVESFWTENWTLLINEHGHLWTKEIFDNKLVDDRSLCCFTPSDNVVCYKELTCLCHCSHDLDLPPTWVAIFVWRSPFAE